jgi:hypothetical protein
MLLYNSIFSDKFFEERKATILHFFKSIDNLSTKVDTLLGWYADLKSGKVAQRTEEQQKSEFLDKIFNEVLAYNGGNAAWKLEKEYNLADGSVADGLLGFFGVQKTPSIRVAIEIKKLKINLDKPQMQRPDRYTPVQQGFHYAHQVKETCDWVVISNLDEIRLYHRTDPNRYESFLFAELLAETAPNEKNLANRFPNLPKFFYLMQYGQLFNDLDQSTQDAIPTTKALYTHRIKRLEEITLSFYNEYKKYRKKLYEHIKSENFALQLPNSEYMHIANKVFDRFIFMRFAQEVDIVNRNVLNGYLHFVRNAYVAEPIAWHSIKLYFNSFDKGYKNDIPPFNGELFKPLPVLDQIVIQNEILIEVLAFMEAYDFKNELKVDILGHIFEQSIAETTYFEDKIPSPTTNLRKRDGVFYTPEHITDFIIQETVMAYLNERKIMIYKELNIDFVVEFEFDLIRWQAQKPELTRSEAIEIYASFFEKYKNVLGNVKILDPACGSGAFLTRVFDYLLKENELVYAENQKFANNLYTEKITETPKLAKQKKPQANKAANDMFDAQTMQAHQRQKELSTLARNILINNLYGVDINFESVEITKLSLWLKMANKYGVSLADLSKNIRKGNSLVSDKNVDEKAFDWENGLFDLIIGNPPYFSLSTQADRYLAYYQENYQVFERTSDIYCLFFEKALTLLKPQGLLAYITSSQWLQTNYGKKLRDFLVQKANPTLLLNFGGVKVFRDATVDSSILVLKNEPCTFQLRAVAFSNDFQMGIDDLNKYVEKNQLLLTDLHADKWTIADEQTLALKEKIKTAGSLLKDWNVKINYGIKTGMNEAFIIDEATKNELIKKDKKSAEIIVPLLRGRDVHQYHAEWANLYLILTKNGTDIKRYPAIAKHLNSFGDAVKKRADQGENWWNLRACAYYDSFAEQKIIYPETTVRRSEFYLDTAGMYIDKTCFMITGEHLAFLNGVLSSTLIEWYLESELRSLGKNSIQYSKQYMENVPLPALERIDKALYQKIAHTTLALTQAYKTNIVGFEILKNELDNAVFELYGISQEEIASIQI